MSQTVATALETIRLILARHEEYRGRLNLPGEGWERAFRGWLAMDLLLQHFGWPTSRIVLGERFDILLLDEGLAPAVTIETKGPHHEASQRETEDFEARLPFYGTLRWAFFTNGEHWARLRLEAPKGIQTFAEKKTFSVEQATEKTAEAFFEVLKTSHFIV